MHPHFHCVPQKRKQWRVEGAHDSVLRVIAQRVQSVRWLRTHWVSVVPMKARYNALCKRLNTNSYLRHSNFFWVIYNPIIVTT